MTPAPLLIPGDRIFVVSHRGMADSAICRALQRKVYRNLLTAGSQDLDLEDAVAVHAWFEMQRPEVLVLVEAKVRGSYANDTYPADSLQPNLKIQNNVIESAWHSGTAGCCF
jgi:GDP-L-fucose synthase